MGHGFFLQSKFVKLKSFLHLWGLGANLKVPNWVHMK